MTAFTFDYKGIEYEIPSFKKLPMGALRKSRKAEDDTDKVFIILENVLAEDHPALAAIDQMDAEDFAKFLEAWTQGAPVGESSSSES